MNALHVISEQVGNLDAAERIGWVLVQSLWQGAMVALLLAIALAGLAKASSRVRYAISCSAMLALIVLPLITAAWAFAPGIGAQRAASTGQIGLPAVLAPSPLVPQPLHGIAQTGAGGAGTMPMILRAVWLAWLAGVAAISVWNLLGWAGVVRLRGRAFSVPNAMQTKLDQLSGLLGITWPVALRRCERISTPVLVGWLWPMVLVPASTLSELPASQLEALLLHELAHVRRHDYLINLIQTMVETVLFYHPAAWWIGRQIRIEREHCCDDIAAARCPSRLDYAKALAAMEELRFGRIPSLALGASDGSLLRRIERLVAPNPRSSRRRVSPVAAGLLLLGVVALLLPVRRGIALPLTEKAGAAPEVTWQGTLQADAIRLEDLQPGPPKDYRISPNDLLSITLSDLSGPNSETVKQQRVTEQGKISLPYLDKPIPAAGLTEFDLEQGIVKAYRDAGLMAHAQVSVTVVEARGRAISIMGEVNKPGEYLLQDNVVRLLSALALAGGVKPDADRIHVLRADKITREGSKLELTGNARMIEVPAAKLLAGDEKLNLVVRPGDTILVSADQQPESRPTNVVRLVVGKDSVRLGDRVATWDEISQGLQKLPDRSDTVLELSPESADVPVGQFFDAQNRAGALVSRLGLRRLSVIEAAPLDARSEKPASHPFVFIYGNVQRPGAYTIHGQLKASKSIP
ncbi:MAG TPA: M56 family metallopeptidase [Tepidisphaeraceae bacterium]|nr:M56 family metallopeptidase [Tepidisphaeraceae bacterium]